MTKFAIVTDTDSSLPIDLAAKYGIRQVPIGINLDGKTIMQATFCKIDQVIPRFC